MNLRGPDVVFAGLCTCGGVTVYYNAEWMPRHLAAGGLQANQARRGVRPGDTPAGSA